MRNLIVFALFVLSQQTLALQSASIRGRVTDSVTGQPLVRATVQLRVRQDNAILARDTDADGTFVFQSVPPGDYTIEATASGYITNLYGERRDEFTPTVNKVQAGQTLSGVQIALTPGAVIYGRIVDDRGERVVGATVQALRTRFRLGLREHTIQQSVISNDLGEYRLFMLPPGEYRVRVMERSFTGASTPWYFPGTADASEAQTVELRAGQTMGSADLSSFPTRGRLVSGTCQGLSGGGSVILSARNSDVQMSKTVSAETGAFEFKGIAPGSYTLVARGNDLVAALPIDVRNADILNARLTLAPGIRVPARIRIEGHGEGDDPALENLYFTIRNDPPIPGLNTDLYSPFANGRISPELLPGDYRIELTRGEDMYVKSIRLGDLDVLDQGLRVPPLSDATLEIFVGTNLGSAQGRIAGKGATVVLVPNLSRRSQRTADSRHLHLKAACFTHYDHAH